jgi:hypothetical protein
MRLKDLFEVVGDEDIRKVLEEMEHRGKKNRSNDIAVCSYIIRAHWRRRPVYKKKSLEMIKGGKL